jgi:hypothetical protein
VVAEGTHDQLLETSEAYRQVLARQVAADGGGLEAAANAVTEVSA